MGDAQQERAAMATAHNMMPANKKELMNNAMKRTTEWIFSQEILSDVTISVQGVSFSLHKADHLVEINDIPGGPKGFELAAKFSYGINFELTFDNIAMVRCVAEFLEMTEDYAVGNLVARTEAYLNEVGFRTLAGAVSILQSSESLLPMAENVKLITRCVDAIALIITTESQSSLSTSIDFSSNETIVSLLPREKNGVSVRFLSLLLRSAIYLETTVACRLDLEKRMGLQLGQALLDDILIPSFRFDGDTLFDIDTLSAEACAHAAQNERLPAETVVQVLYYEQQRLQETMDDASKPSPFLEGMSSLQKENEDLKLELLEVKCRLKEVKKSYPDKSPSRGRSFMSLVSKKFVKLTPFLWADHGISPSSTRSRNKNH
ncbi:BTB/POZ fold [Cynara cardunculus var. scolymus]|uniref:BTB/POZ fold n=1 Tax=Cynara cardunculus var. scolymus TaxID=59895 RepID=A0A103Y548_CYNCS|nr:BTB/POZ fold [Cynara cardunculus var. scolymus]